MEYRVPIRSIRSIVRRPHRLLILLVTSILVGCSSTTDASLEDGLHPVIAERTTSADTAAPSPRVPTDPTLDLELLDSGCSVTHIAVPADKPPLIKLANSGSGPLVFTVPKFAVSIHLAPNEGAEMPINPFLQGQFPYYCLDAETHTKIGGHDGIGIFACPLDPATLDGVALSKGSLSVEQHQRPG